MKNYSKLQILNGVKSICLLTHMQPDADALSSTIVFREFLKKHFNVSKVDIFSECSNVPENCLPILNRVKVNNKPTNYQVAIMMDCPNSDRLGEYKLLFDKSKTKIVIDHHATNQYQGDVNIVEFVSSTCEIIYSILKHFKFQISNENKGKLYAGLITDTNNFTVGNITPITFKIANEFAPHINRELIYKNFLANNTLKNLQLLSLAIQNTVTFEHGQIIISHITQEQANQYRANFDDCHSIVNELATINSAKLVCFIRPKENGYYVSLRGRQKANVSRIAKKYNGGGHIGAAAFISDKSLMELEQIILNEFREELTKIPKQSEKIF